jgi:hypothetical protein
MRFIFGVIVAVVVLSFMPGDVKALSNVRIQILSLFSGNRAMEAMMAQEQQRLAKIRRDFGEWKAAEACRQDIGEFERFARDHLLPPPNMSCN